MKRLRFFIIPLVLFFNSNCGIFYEKEKNRPDPLLFLGLISYMNSTACNQEGNFWVRNVQTNRSECIRFILESRGEFSEIYREERLANDLNYQEISDQFDTLIHPAVTEAFGEPSDINGDGRVTVLVLDIRDGAEPGGPFVAGFFDPVDLLDGFFNPSLRSNQREILYMDGKELVGLLTRDPLAFGSTLAHEYQHLIRFPIMRQSGVQDDIWIDEGSSELASDIGGFGPQTHRLDCLIGASTSPCNGGGNNVSLMDWGRAPENDPTYILKQYSYAYAFMRYLYDNSGSSPDLRRLFLLDTVYGFNGIRANNLINLLTIFRNSTGHTSMSSFPTNPLGTNSNETFFLLLHAFWGQIIPGMDLSNVIRYDSGSGVQVNLIHGNDIRVEFPLGGYNGNDGILYSIKDRSEFPSRVSLPGTIPSGSFNRLFNAVNPGSISSPLPVSTTPIETNEEAFLFYGVDRSGRLNSISSSLVSVRKDWNEFRKEFESSDAQGLSKSPVGIKKFPKGTGNRGIPVCGHPFLGNN